MVASLVLAVSVAGTAVARPNGTFDCRASSVRVGAGAQTFEPLVANTPSNPCRVDNPGSFSQVSNTSGAGTLSAQVLGASTDQNPSRPSSRAPADGDGPTARATTGHVTIVTGTTTIDAETLSATATGRCAAGSPILDGSSQTGRVTVNGNEVTSNGSPHDIPVPGGMLHLNAAIPGPNSLTVRALWLETAAGDVVVAEASVGWHSAPCEDVAPPPPPPPPPNGAGCRGSAVVLGAIEPVIANPSGKGCARSDQYVADQRFLTGTVTARSLDAATDQDPSTGPMEGWTGRADAGANDLELRIDGHDILVRLARAHVSLECFGGMPRMSSTSSVAGLKIDGGSVPVDPGTRRVDTPAGSLVLNSVTSTPNKTTRVAIALDTAVGPIRIGVATGGFTGNPCA